MVYYIEVLTKTKDFSFHQIIASFLESRKVVAKRERGRKQLTVGELG
jgi:hypothetical protein